MSTARRSSSTAELPIESEQPTTQFRRLMVAQDTGGAIIGPARADIYFGAGDEAGRISPAASCRRPFVMLVPNDIVGGGRRATCRCRGRAEGRSRPSDGADQRDGTAAAAASRTRELRAAEPRRPTDAAALADDERALWTGVTRSIAPLRKRAAGRTAAPVPTTH